ncbi:MAG: sigma-70 family RNA polymerase sigma factor [Actinobacteria bacterium]|nr:sigma-70 family RNA polymerase sigma factor [Actinomycetota bacterium]
MGGERGGFADLRERERAHARRGSHMNGQSMDPEVAALVERGLEVVPKVVASIAANFPRHVERAELIRAGALGVVEAAWRFDSARGVPFERFVATRIRGAVLDAVRADDWAPRSLRAAARRIEMVESSLTARYGRRPTTEELAAESGTTTDRVITVKALVETSVVGRLDHGQSDDAAVGFRPHEPVDRAQRDVVELLEYAELLAYLREAIDGLSQRQRRVILGQFVDGQTTMELASELGITRSRVSQLRADALRELRRSITGHYGPVPARKDESVQTAASFPVSTTA